MRRVQPEGVWDVMTEESINNLLAAMSLLRFPHLPVGEVCGKKQNDPRNNIIAEKQNSERLLHEVSPTDFRVRSCDLVDRFFLFWTLLISLLYCSKALSFLESL